MSLSEPSSAILPALDSTLPVLRIESIDPAVDARSNFYRYACGRWLDTTAIPADRAHWSRFAEAMDRNRAILRQLLEDAADLSKPRSPLDQKIGDLYASFQDTGRIESDGIAPLGEELARIDGLKDPRRELPALLAALHTIGVKAGFSLAPAQHLRDSRQCVASFDVAALGLPSRDPYLQEDPSQRQHYVEHIRAMFEAMGREAGRARAEGQVVLDFETTLASASLPRLQRRDPTKLDHWMSIRELESRFPPFDWTAYLAHVGITGVTSVNVTEPAVFEQFVSLVASKPVESVAAYLRWRLLSEFAPLLPSRFASEHFRFHGTVLRGAAEPPPRWKQAVELVNRELGHAVGQRFVERALPQDAKARATGMVQEIRGAFSERLRQADWLTEETRTRALEKLEAMGAKIGYPERWREHDSLQIVPGDLIGNVKRCRRFEFLYQARRIGNPIQPDDWPVPPQTFSMFYRAQRNEIICPAAVLQPPFFDASADDAVNYGGLGAGIAHEMTHGFDDQGRKFNRDGNLDDWWTDQDALEFERRARILVEQYNAYAIDEGPVNGQLTLGENIADLGGLRIAFRALVHRLAGMDLPPVEGFTWKQRFFLSYAQTWQEKARAEESRLRLSIDPHAPGEWRVNGVVVNMPEFWEAFGGVSPVRTAGNQDIW